MLLLFRNHMSWLWNYQDHIISKWQFLYGLCCACCGCISWILFSDSRCKERLPLRCMENNAKHFIHMNLFTSEMPVEVWCILNGFEHRPNSKQNNSILCTWSPFVNRTLENRIIYWHKYFYTNVVSPQHIACFTT